MRGRRRRRLKQLSIAYPSGWGGKRKGAGRKRRGRTCVPHRRRERFSHRHPLLVTVRLVDGLPTLRRLRMARVLAKAFAAGCRKPGFRICQFSIQSNHMHLVCEAADAVALTRGMQGFSIRVARALNRHLERSGRVFADRYHARVMRRPRQVRHGLCYVLQNARRHGVHRYREPGWVDPFSSARYFDGWSGPVELAPVEPGTGPPVARAQTWLLTTGWTRWGLIGVDEVPAAGRFRA